MSNAPADLYSALGVEHGATAAAIEAAYVALRSRAPRPDTEAMARIQYAYDVLIDPQRRALYDSLLADTTGPALRVDYQLGAGQVPVLDETQVVYAMITVRGREQAEARQLPLNLALVTDRSTSMRGARLARVVAAAELLLDKMGPEDVFSLVSFSDRAEVVLPAGNLSGAAQPDDPAAAAAWRDPKVRLRAMTASGGTEIYHGLAAGLAQLRSHAGLGGISHLILLTDGQTYGDEALCLQLAESAAAQGIGISAFGIGHDWNDAFLDSLVAPSGGQSGYVEQPADLVHFLEHRLQGLDGMHAHNVRLNLNIPAALKLRSAFKLSPATQSLALDNGELRLGDLEGRAAIITLLEFHLQPQTVPARFRLPLTIRYAPPGTAPAQPDLDRMLEQQAEFLVLEPESVSSGPPASLIEAARRLNLYQMQELAWEEAQAGRLDMAAARMQQLTARFRETGDLRLAQQAHLEAQRLARLGSMSPEGRKVLKYGTRSLMGQLDA